MKYKQKNFISFDGTEKFQLNLAMPDRYSALFECLDKGTQIVPGGAGLSFCAASGLPGGTTVSSKYFDRLISFDEEKGLVTTETGISVGLLHSFCLDKGWILPAIPGYPKITIGGCIAFNIHGKSQFHNGNFIDHIESLKVYHPSHGEMYCDRVENSDVFYLTVGGFGLTGFITQVTLRLAKLRGKSVRITKKYAKNLTDAVKIMEKYSNQVDVLYSWNNLNVSGDKFGEGVVYLEEFSNDVCKDKYKEGSLSSSRKGLLGLNMYNAAVVRLMTVSYGMLEKIFYNVKSTDLKTATFPINGKEIYYYFFGKTGLREYQFIVPRNKWEEAAHEVAKSMRKHKIFATLGSLKLFKGETTYLNFCADGVCLAIDVPATSNSIDFFKDLDSVVVDKQGILNLSKDGRISGDLVKKIFPEYGDFSSRLHEYDPKKLFDSALRRRIGV